jgi:hypothetical protein
MLVGRLIARIGLTALALTFNEVMLVGRLIVRIGLAALTLTFYEAVLVGIGGFCCFKLRAAKITDKILIVVGVGARLVHKIDYQAAGCHSKHSQNKDCR